MKRAFAVVATFLWVMPLFAIEAGEEKRQQEMKEQGIPRIIIIRVKQEQRGQDKVESEPEILLSDSAVLPTDDSSAQQVEVGARGQIEKLDVDRARATDTPMAVDSLFRLQEHIAADAIENNSSHNRWGIYGRGGFYGYGHRGHYGYGHSYPWRHGSYGYHWGRYLYPYLHRGFHRVFGPHRYYYYHNPYYHWG